MPGPGDDLEVTTSLTIPAVELVEYVPIGGEVRAWECLVVYGWHDDDADGERDPGEIGRFNAGWDVMCDRCDYEANRENGARVIADVIVCEECMTLEDWKRSWKPWIRGTDQTRGGAAVAQSSTKPLIHSPTHTVTARHSAVEDHACPRRRAASICRNHIPHPTPRPARSHG